MLTHHDALPTICKWHARLALAVFAAALLFFVAITFSPLKSGFADAASRGPGDVELYRAEVERIRAGQPYYDAAADELRARGYPTRNVFNWRTPLPVALIGSLPNTPAAQAILGALALTLMWLSFGLLVDAGSLKQGLLVVVLLSGALLPCMLGDLVVMSELWAGVLIALSAVCYALDRHKAGLAAGLAALFFRELAAPYCLVCMAIALGHRRYRELLVWSIGLAAYAVFFGFHVSQVLPRIAPTDLAHAESWVRFGGAGFLISTVQMNAYLLLLPQWIAAVYLAFALVGCAGSNLPNGNRIGLPIAAYTIAFSVAGHDFNQYWGSLLAPLFCLAVAQSPQALARLWKAAAIVPTPRGSVSLQS